VQAAVGGARHELHAVRRRVQRADRRAVRLPGRLGGRQLARRGRRVVHRQARAMASGAAPRQRAAPAVQRHHLGPERVSDEEDEEDIRSKTTNPSAARFDMLRGLPGCTGGASLGTLAGGLYLALVLVKP